MLHIIQYIISVLIAIYDRRTNAILGMIYVALYIYIIRVCMLSEKSCLIDIVEICYKDILKFEIVCACIRVYILHTNALVSIFL